MVNDVIVICTRNRPDDMSRFMNSLLGQQRLPKKALVVDSSDGDATEELVTKFSHVNKHVCVQYARTAAGLTYQRNYALRLIREKFDVVHFVDDDVELEPNYLAELNDAFERMPELVGAGGAIIDWWNGRRPSAFARFALADSNKSGVVTRAGFNVMVREVTSAMDVEWLSGCSMSYRSNAISNLWFDERRKGYAIGEDVDFGLRASAIGRVLFIPTARLYHHESPVNRHKRPYLVRMGINHRWTLAEDGLGRVGKGWVFYGTAMLGMRHLIQYLRAGFKDYVQWQCFKASVEGLRDIVMRSLNPSLMRTSSS